MVYFYIPRFAFVYPTFFRVFFISGFEKQRPDLCAFNLGLDGRAGGVLFLNTAAYSAEIFYGALQSIPKGDLDAADAYALSGWARFRRIIWPTMLRLGWPGYTNEAIFLFHSTTLVFFSAFPAWQQRGDALYYANYFADKTFNPFIPYPILAGYFVLLTFLILVLFGLINKRLNRHLPPDQTARLKLRPTLIR